MALPIRGSAVVLCGRHSLFKGRFVHFAATQQKWMGGMRTASICSNVNLHRASPTVWACAEPAKRVVGACAETPYAVY